MEFTEKELSLIHYSIKLAREKAEENFVKAMRIAQKDLNEDEVLIIGVAESLEVMNNLNNLRNKLEEIQTKR